METQAQDSQTIDTELTADLFTRDGKPLWTTGQVAAWLGITVNSLQVFMSRHAGLSPQKKVGQDWFWRTEEVTAFAQAKSRAKRGRPAKV